MTQLTDKLRSEVIKAHERGYTNARIAMGLDLTEAQVDAALTRGEDPEKREDTDANK